MSKVRAKGPPLTLKTRHSAASSNLAAGDTTVGSRPNSLNKLTSGIADNLTLSIVAEAIGRRTPVIVAPSLNQPLLDHPASQASLKTLSAWGVIIVPPMDEVEGPRLAPIGQIIDAVRPFVA